MVHGLKIRQALLQTTLDLIQAGDNRPSAMAIATIAGVAPHDLDRMFQSVDDLYAAAFDLAVSLGALVRSACSLALSDADAYGIRHSIALDAAADRIEVDPVQIQQLLLNLVRNAAAIARKKLPANDEDLSLPGATAVGKRAARQADVFSQAPEPVTQVDELIGTLLRRVFLLDPQLRTYLPPDSNIVRFQDRFTLAYVSTEKADQDVLSFVFGNDQLPLDQLPQRSTLERAVVAHLRSGGHWHLGRGWFEL